MDTAWYLKLNHPSAIEPSRAATGVGGIHHDIFTGARPIMSLLNHCVSATWKEAKHSICWQVCGTRYWSHYGNWFWCTNRGGEIYFEQCYHTSTPLVNAMSVGLEKRWNHFCYCWRCGQSLAFLWALLPVKTVLAVPLCFGRYYCAWKYNSPAVQVWSVPGEKPLEARLK